MHARTLAFCVRGAMPALAAVARLTGMHVCFPARIMTGLVHFGPANRLSGPVVSRHPTAAPVAGSPRRISIVGELHGHGGPSRPFWHISIVAERPHPGREPGTLKQLTTRTP